MFFFIIWIPYPSKSKRLFSTKKLRTLGFSFFFKETRDILSPAYLLKTTFWDLIPPELGRRVTARTGVRRALLLLLFSFCCRPSPVFLPSICTESWARVWRRWVLRCRGASSPVVSPSLCGFGEWVKRLVVAVVGFLGWIEIDFSWFDLV